MPDHFHAVLAGTTPAARLSPLVRIFKGNATAILRHLGFQNVWQKGFHDHVIRNADDLRSSIAYVLENPVRAGLVKHPRDYPYSSSFLFDWHSSKLAL